MMKISREWCNFFNIPEEKVKHWLSEAKSADNFTFWCLKNGKISNKDYLQWAKNYYKLPVLKADYFQQKIDTSWWGIVKSISNWSEKLIPIAEWDNTIFIACIEPYNDIHWSFPVQFLLASSEDLEKRWKELNTSIEENTSEKSVVHQPAEQKKSVTFTTPQKEQAKATQTPPNLEAPEGMALSLTENVSSHTNSSSQDLEAPEGMNLSLEKMKEDSTKNLMQESYSSSQDLEAPEGMNLSIKSVEDNVAPEGLDNIKSKSTTETSSPMIAPSPPTPTISMAEKSPKVPATKEVAETKNTKESTLQFGTHPEVQNIFKELQEHFDAAMVLMFEGEMLKPWVSDGWQPSHQEALTPINVNEPCIFRIVKVSGQPFHGPISSNYINDQFFQNWGYSKNPDHVTITPIKYDHFIAGMVLAVGSGEKSSTMTALDKMEKVTEKLKPILESLKIAS